MRVALRERRRARRCPVAPISVADVDSTEMADGLWQGGLGTHAGCPIAFSDLHHAVVLCPTDQDQGRRVVVLWPAPIKIPLLDSKSDLKRIGELLDLASRLASRIDGGENIGIFCWQGRNRSGLLTALTLRKLKGWSGREAMEHIQRLRPEALDTQSGAFEEYLDRLARPRR
jgi:hypothetical protein